MENSFNENYRERSGRVLDSRPKGHRFQPHWCHCVVSLSKNINLSLVLVQPKKTDPYITERLLMGRKESNQTNKINKNYEKDSREKNSNIQSEKKQLSDQSTLTFILHVHVWRKQPIQHPSV